MLSRNQQLAQDYLQAGELLYQALPSELEQGLRECLFAVDGAVASFGLCELHYRQASRENTLGVARSRLTAEESVRRYNSAGLNTLSDAQASLSSFRDELKARSEGATQDVDRRMLGQRLEEFREGLRFELANLELKAKDVEQLNERLDRAIEVGRGGDPFQLVDFIGERVRELEEVRRSGDRGTSENIPWWKIVAVAVFFAISVWALIKCAWRWWGLSCSPNEALIYVLIAKAAALGYKLC